MISLDYFKPPLAFLGNKTRFLKPFSELLGNMQIAKMIDKDTIIYDVFGGSGLLAHTAKRTMPKNRVIWNDYDNYARRLSLIPITDEIRAKCVRVIAQTTPEELKNKKKNKSATKLTDEQKQAIMEVINSYHKDDIDYITLNSYFNFIGLNNRRDSIHLYTFADLNITPLTSPEGYLKGVERVRQDCFSLLDSIESHSNALLILDPPYLASTTNSYSDSFSRDDYTRLFNAIKDKQLILFGSEKSGIWELVNAYDFRLEFQVERRELRMKGGGGDLMIHNCRQKGLFSEGF